MSSSELQAPRLFFSSSSSWWWCPEQQLPCSRLRQRWVSVWPEHLRPPTSSHRKVHFITITILTVKEETTWAAHSGFVSAHSLSLSLSPSAHSDRGWWWRCWRWWRWWWWPHPGPRQKPRTAGNRALAHANTAWSQTRRKEEEEKEQEDKRDKDDQEDQDDEACWTSMSLWDKDEFCLLSKFRVSLIFVRFLWKKLFFYSLTFTLNNQCWF